MFSSKEDEKIETQERFGFLFEDLDDKSQYQKMYQAVFTSRRAIYTLVLIRLGKVPIL